MRYCSIMGTMFLLLLATGAHASDELLKKELIGLEGRWDLFSVEYGGQTGEVGTRDQQTWEIKGDQLTRFMNSKRVDVAQLEIAPQTTPKHMDLVPIEIKDPSEVSLADRQKLLTRTKCLYTLHGEELRVAFTFGFYPGTPEAERRLAIGYAKRRPQSFDTKTPDPPVAANEGDVVVFLFKRAKKD